MKHNACTDKIHHTFLTVIILKLRTAYIVITKKFKVILWQHIVAELTEIDTNSQNIDKKQLK